MLGRLKAICKSLPPDLGLWAAVTLVLAFAFLNSLGSISRLPAEETRYANNHRQRVIIDPSTGIVSTSGQASKGPAFDVGTSSDTPAAPDMGKPTTPSTTTPEAANATTMPSNLPVLRTAPQITQFPVVGRSPDSLVRAPAPDISEKLGELTLPKRSTGSGSPSAIYGRGFTRIKDQHILAVLVTDIGYSPESLAAALTLPKGVGVAITPYATGALQQVETLRNAGYEVWTMLPVEDERYPQNDPGPLGILGAMSNSEMLGRLHIIMANTLGSVGMVMAPDQQLSKTEKLWHALRADLDQRGMLMLLTHLTPETQTLVSDMAQLNVRLSDTILDTTPSEAFIRDKLSKLLEQVKSQEVTVVVLSARPQAIGMLREWLNNMPGNITLAPVSAIYRAEFKQVEGGMSKEEREEKLIQRRSH